MPEQLTAIVQRMIDAGESEDNIGTVIRAYKPQPQPDSGALPVAGIAAAVAPAATLAAEVATNPNVPRGAATLGRISGAIEGGLKGGPLAIGPGAWAGGKAGWFSGKLMQSAAAPVASVMEKALPYSQALSTVAGAQGVNDLAQMAEPNRTDIGFMGVGSSPQRAMHMTPEAYAQYDKDHPTLLRDVYNRVKAKLIGQ